MTDFKNKQIFVVIHTLHCWFRCYGRTDV